MKSENKEDTAPVLRQSCVSLAGRLNARQGLRHEDLPSSQWTSFEMSKEVFVKLQRTYYTSLLNSMSTIAGNDNHSVYRYEMKIAEESDNLIFLTEKGYIYPCKIKNVRLWFFPFDITLFSIEIEEHTDSFSDLTLMHSKWKKWAHPDFSVADLHRPA